MESHALALLLFLFSTSLMLHLLFLLLLLLFSIDFLSLLHFFHLLYSNKYNIRFISHSVECVRKLRKNIHISLCTLMMFSTNVLITRITFLVPLLLLNSYCATAALGLILLLYGIIFRIVFVRWFIILMVRCLLDSRVPWILGMIMDNDWHISVNFPVL